MRSYQYLMTIAVTLLAGIWFVPSSNANYTVLIVDGYRGIYNSAWIGAIFVMLSTTVISLFGFYVVRGSIERDRRNRVGEIIAATPTSTFVYLLGKMLSHIAVLLSMLVVLFADAVAMQLLRGEDRSIHIWQIAEPLAIMSIPVIAVVAALAVLFDALPILRGGIGNIAFFFLWVTALVPRRVPTWLDPLGMWSLTHQIARGVPHQLATHHLHSTGFGATSEKAKLFVWHGFTWTPGFIAERYAFVLVAIVTVAIAAIFFDRFSSAHRESGAPRRRTPFAGVSATLARISQPILAVCFRSDFGSIVLAELRLMLQGLSAWWWIIAAGLWIATLFVPNAAQSTLLSLAWIWAILIWSQMGTRESANGTEQLIYPTLHPLRRQFLAQWYAGVLLALALGSGALLHAFASGSLHQAIGPIVGAFFLPTLALACGAIAQSPRLFEVCYLILWYAGPMNHTPSIDYTSTAAGAAFSIATVVLFVAAFSARRLRLQLM